MGKKSGCRRFLGLWMKAFLGFTIWGSRGVKKVQRVNYLKVCIPCIELCSMRYLNCSSKMGGGFQFMTVT